MQAPGNPGPKDWPTLIKEFYEESIEEKLLDIELTNKQIKETQKIREEHSEDWETVERCREILFYNAKRINKCLEEIEDDRARIKELGRVSG